MSTGQRGILVIISGFSGVGKGTVVKELMAKHADAYALSVSATTRSPREGEVEGVHYFFKTKEEFQEMINQNQLIEYACFVNNYYGTPKAYVDSQLEAGKNVILEIELQGAFKVREQFPDTRLLFIVPPDAKTLQERLVGRGTDAADVIESRLARAYEEASYVDQYDYLVVNDELENAVENVHQVITSECSGDLEAVQDMLVSSNEELVSRLKDELKVFSKGE